MLNLSEVFEKFDDEYGKFERIDNPLSPRSDLCAFVLLDKLAPGTEKMLSYAGHDQVVLSVDCDALASAATEADIETLVRCRVRYNESENSLEMFV